VVGWWHSVRLSSSRPRVALRGHRLRAAWLVVVFVRRCMAVGAAWRGGRLRAALRGHCLHAALRGHHPCGALRGRRLRAALRGRRHRAAWHGRRLRASLRGRCRYIARRGGRLRAAVVVAPPSSSRSSRGDVVATASAREVR
jgi:hypothetical protein